MAPTSRKNQSPLSAPGTGRQPLGPGTAPTRSHHAPFSPSASFLRSASSFVVYEYSPTAPSLDRLTSHERPTDRPKPSCGRGELCFRYCDVMPVLSTRSRSACIDGGVSPGKLYLTAVIAAGFIADDSQLSRITLEHLPSSPLAGKSAVRSLLELSWHFLLASFHLQPPMRCKLLCTFFYSTQAVIGSPRSEGGGRPPATDHRHCSTHLQKPVGSSS